MAEGRDWVTTAHGECPDCGYDPTLIAVTDFDEALEIEASAWARWLESADDAALRMHTFDGIWSGLEYACHVRDLLAVFAARVDLLREGETGDLGWWDHEAAVATNSYNSQSVSDVVEQLVNNSMILSAATIGVEGEVWQRSADRRPGESFSIAELVRFAMHESFHHRLDAIDAVSRASTD